MIDVGGGVLPVLLSLWIAAAPAAPEPDPSVVRAVSLVEGLFLYPDDLNAGALLKSAADALAQDLHWLIVEGDDAGVVLRHGDGRAIGAVSAASMDTLPQAIASMQQLVEEFDEDLGDTQVRLELMKGLAYGLDKYSRVLAGDRLARFDTRLKGTLVGVGATLFLSNDELMVGGLIADGPAERGGLKVGDRIVRIDGRSTVNMPIREATRLIRGDVDTRVILDVERPVEGETMGEAQVKPLKLTLTRAEVVVENVVSKVLDDDLAYVRITHISQRTLSNLMAALTDLRAKGVLDKGLVMDLRGNTGGSMKQSARVVDEFVEGGLLLRTAGPDGGQVRNLQNKMVATEGGAALDVPVVILVDDRTASGAEIIAGGLLELDRAVLIGERTYGKGTVQKVYTLEEGARLKLTVAEYILANDRHIAGVGMVPDVVVGTIRMDDYGVRYYGFDEDRNRVDFEQVLGIVDEREGWRGEARRAGDQALELAKRTLRATEKPSREALLADLTEQAAELRKEQEQHLVEALGAKEVDWSPAESPLVEPVTADVTVTARTDDSDPDLIRVRAEVRNDGKEPLHRALVELSCESLSHWNGLVMPIGLLDPGQTGTAEVAIPLRAGVNPREDVVQITLRTDKNSPVDLGSQVVSARSSREPRLQLTAWFEDVEGPVDLARLTVTNPLDKPLEDVEVYFRYPGDIDVELVDHASRVSEIPANGSHTFDLKLKAGQDAPSLLPLLVVVENWSYGEMVEWPIEVPMNGGKVVLKAPQVASPQREYAVPVGTYELPVRVEDDRRLDHVVVYLNGKKVGWHQGGRSSVSLSARAELQEGVNRFLVHAVDDQGLRTVEQFVVRGEAALTTDAEH